MVSISRGNPPPEKWYGKRHAVMPTSNALTAQRPDRRIESFNGVYASDVNPERATRRFLAILEMVAGSTLDPLGDTSSVDALESHEGIGPVRGPPDDGVSQVCSK